MTTQTIAYYDRTATSYDKLHDTNNEHTFAIETVWPFLTDIKSALDVGSGTGRMLRWLRRHDPAIELHGVEPSSELRRISQEIENVNIINAFGEHLPYPDDSIDLVMASAIMHHVDDPRSVIDEMFRVARKAILISDHNNFAFGSDVARRIRLALFSFGLLPLATFIKQGFKKQGYSTEDGWWYPYSILSNHNIIAERSCRIFYIPTRRINSKNFGHFFLNQSHIAVLAIKRG